MLNIVRCTKLRYYNLTSQKGDPFYSVVILRGILIDNWFLHLLHLITISALFSLLLESGAILGFLSESHILLWHNFVLIVAEGQNLANLYLHTT